MQIDSRAVKAWVERYVAAWNSNDQDEIGDLFTTDASYLPRPFREPWKGRDEIVRQWLAHKDEPGTTTFEYAVVAVDGNTGVVRGVTTYLQPPALYGNIWIVKLDEEGRASFFAEYWMEPP